MANYWATGTPVYSMNDVTWQQWNITASSSTNKQIWVTWTTTSTNTTSTSNYWVQDPWTAWNEPLRTVHLGHVETAEEREAKARAKREARQRALDLLLSQLDDEQAAAWADRQEFEIVGSDGKRYLIREGRQHNIFELDDAGNKVVELCGHVRDAVPDEDNVLAQKLALEHDAADFRRIANKWALDDGRRQPIAA